jgi:CheY-like chemotaxis protein
LIANAYRTGDEFMGVASRILIVEDLDFWQEALSEVLTDSGHQVHIAPSHAEALVALTENEYQLAIIDPVLDDANRRNRDGLYVLQHILDQRPEIGAVVITSSDPNRIRREVSEMSPGIPLLWKDEWDDDRFLGVVSDLLSMKGDTVVGDR